MQVNKCFTRPQLVIKDMKWQTETEEKMTAQDSRNKHVNSLELYSFLLYINCFDFHCSPEVWQRAHWHSTTMLVKCFVERWNSDNVFLYTFGVKMALHTRMQTLSQRIWRQQHEYIDPTCLVSINEQINKQSSFPSSPIWSLTDISSRTARYWQNVTIYYNIKVII